MSSVCPIHPVEKAPGDPLFAYRPAMTAMGDALRGALSPQCLPQALPAHADGTAACGVFLLLPAGDESLCQAEGLSVPAPDALASVRSQLEQAWTSGGGASSGAPDPATLPLCELKQLAPGTCASSAAPGWCYDTGAQAGGCPQRIDFSPGEPLPGAEVLLQCGP